MLEMMNSNLFNKCVGLVLSHIVEYSSVNLTRERELPPRPICDD